MDLKNDDDDDDDDDDDFLTDLVHICQYFVALSNGTSFAAKI